MGKSGVERWCAVYHWLRKLEEIDKKSRKEILKFRFEGIPPRVSSIVEIRERAVPENP